MVNNTAEHNMVDFLDLSAEELRTLCDRLMNDPDSLTDIMREHARKQMRMRRERIARNNQTYAQALSQMTDKQALETSKLDGNGYKINQVIWHKADPYGNVAVMLVKPQVYDDVSGKVKQKIIVVYSNGTVDSTFEKKINIRKVL
jgi:hypothetical protein